jgi:hypothetical protein
VKAGDLVLAINTLRVRDDLDCLLDAVGGCGRPPPSQSVRLGQTGHDRPIADKNGEDPRRPCEAGERQPVVFPADARACRPATFADEAKEPLLGRQLRVAPRRVGTRDGGLEDLTAKGGLSRRRSDGASGCYQAA